MQREEEKMGRLVSRGLWWSCSLVAVASLLGAAEAQGAALAFDQINNSGIVQYNDDGGPLTGTNIVFETMTGINTDNDGTIDCTGCLLNFTTGDLFTVTASDPSVRVYTFLPGGSFTVTGASNDAGLGQRTLLDGIWTKAVTVTLVDLGSAGFQALTVIGVGVDDKDPDLIDYFFDPPLPTDFSFVNSDILIESDSGGLTAIGQLGFRADLSQGGNADLTNATVPEPVSALLLGAGLLGLARAGRRRS